MEDIKAYIESGILELYVLGDLSPEERHQVEAMASKHPAVKAELVDIEVSMERYALENAIEPNENLRDRILNSLLTNLGDDRIFDKKASNAGASTDNVVSITSKSPVNFYKYAFAACLALLLASVIVLVNVYSKLTDANTQLLAMNNQNQHFASTVKYMDQELGVYRDTTFKVIKLKGMAKHTSSSMMMAYSPVKKKVMIDMADMALPENDQAHQYQLWAIVDKKPVSLGVFDKSATDSSEMKEMASVNAPQAFAVTLEARGGSPTPHLDQLMVSNL